MHCATSVACKEKKRSWSLRLLPLGRLILERGVGLSRLFLLTRLREFRFASCDLLPSSPPKAAANAFGAPRARIQSRWNAPNKYVMSAIDRYRGAFRARRAKERESKFSRGTEHNPRRAKERDRTFAARVRVYFIKFIPIICHLI